MDDCARDALALHKMNGVDLARIFKRLLHAAGHVVKQEGRVYVVKGAVVLEDWKFERRSR